MRFVVSLDPYEFFGRNGYPFDLDQVERRDGSKQQLQFIQTIHEIAGIRILDAGCGNGRLSGPLLEAGAEVVAVDVVGDVLRTGKARHPKVLFVQADLGALPFTDDGFDCIISFYSSIGYRADRLLAELRELRRVTRDNGLLLLDLINGLRPVRHLGAESWRGGVGFWFKMRYRDQVVQWNLAISKSLAGLFRLTYPLQTISSISEILIEAGWQVRATFGDYDGSPLLKDSRRLITVCAAI